MTADTKTPSADAPTPVRLLRDKAFLGPEYVTWLYFTLIDEGFEIGVPNVNDDTGAPVDVRFAIGKKAMLNASGDHTGPKITLSGAGLEDNGEVLQAIRRGALVESLSLELSIDTRVYAFTLGSDGALSGVKLPDLFTDPDEGQAASEQSIIPTTRKKRRPALPIDDIVGLRMQCLDELEHVIDSLFETFLSRRLGTTFFTDDVEVIRAAVATGLHNRLLPMGGA